MVLRESLRVDRILGSRKLGAAEAVGEVGDRALVGVPLVVRDVEGRGEFGQLEAFGDGLEVVVNWDVLVGGVLVVAVWARCGGRIRGVVF